MTTAATTRSSTSHAPWALALLSMVGCSTGQFEDADPDEPANAHASDQWDTVPNFASVNAVKVSVSGSAVTASANDGNVPANTVDGSLSTRWSAAGDGQWIRYDLGSTRRVDFVRVAFYNGASRVFTFDVQTSTDGSNWVNARTGLKSALNNNLQLFDLTDVDARYVRYLGHMNSTSTWNALTEVEVWTVSSSGTGGTGGTSGTGGTGGTIPPPPSGGGFVLNADGPGSTYERLSDFGWGIEVPDCGHAGRHISEAFDSQLGRNVFVFTLHRDLDDDRCINTDRQRAELRGNAPHLQATYGTTSYYRWKFKLDAGFKASPNFGHIMQVKAYGNGHGSGSPIVTVSVRYESVLEISHYASGGVKARGNLGDLRGEWAEAFFKLRHANDGSAFISIRRVRDGKTIAQWSGSVDMWEDGALHGSPKLGLYRSLSSKSYLRDESVRYADLCFSEKSESECPSGIR